ncbi:MAG: protein-L-isoaspartate O-methyltransferase family protein [Hyphomicrobium sp.]
MADTALQRKNMVESQVRPSDVTDRRITSAMMSLPREAFLPERLAALAYSDAALPLDGERSLMAPRDFARLIQLAGVEGDERVLVVGSGVGYSAAVLSRMARDIVALDSDAYFTSAAIKALGAVGAANVSAVTGELAAGWPERAPYDVIILEGCVEAVPEGLKGQLAPGGRLIAVLVGEGSVGRAALFGTEDSAPLVAFEAAAPRLPGFGSALRGFEF